MTTVTWNDALQGVSPITGGQPLPPATYRFRPVAGVGKINSSQGVMLELQLEVVSGPLQGRKAFHNENLPKGNTDQDKTRMGFFLGLCEAFGITGAMLGQMFGGQPITKESIDYLAQYLVQQGQVIKGTVRPQKNDASRINIGNWTPDDGIEPEPPVQKPVQAGPPQGQFGPPTTPNGAVPGPGGFAPPSGPPQIGGAQQGGFPPAQAPAAQQGGGLPLGGFPGSGGMQPNPAPDWATQQPVQGQAPQQLQGPGQMAPAAQPQAVGMNQFAQPQAAQFPQMGQQPQQAMQEGFPGQQFPGQANPAAFPPPGQAPQGGFQPPAGLPGQMPPGQPQQAPAGLPQGGFPPVGQGQPPQANI